MGYGETALARRRSVERDRRVVKWAPAMAAVWAGFIFFLSCFDIHRSAFIGFVDGLIPSEALRHAWVSLWSAAGIFVVKGFHVAEFAVLFTLLNHGVRQTAGVSSRVRIALCAGCCLLYAASDEWHQTFVPGRHGSIVDVAIDGIGIAFAAACAVVAARRRLWG